jgi:penicillin-binding protein 1A
LLRWKAVATRSKPPAKRDAYVPRHAPEKIAAKASKKAGGRRSFLRRRWWLFVLLTPLLLGVLASVAVLVAYARIQLPETLPPIRTTYVYDRNGELITTLHGAVDRTVVKLNEMSPYLIDAVIATEDKDFYTHSGVDPVGIARAAWTNFRGTDNEVQGASTITQQLVKNVYAGEYVEDEETGLTEYVQPDRTVQQKVREILLAVKLEQELGKDRILAQYLNTVYFGHGAYGIEAAAQTYFDKPAKRLNVVQAATLAGVLHAPELYDPIDRPYDNEFRRDYALDQMARYGYLDPAEAERLKEKKCCGTIEEDESERLAAPGDAEYFVDHVRRTLFDMRGFGSARVYGGGLQVTTTLDLRLQEAAEAAIATHLPDEGTDPEAALVAIDVSDGGILAMAGGRDWQESKVNLATAAGGGGRQAGSAFKAFTLAEAMQQGYDLNAWWQGPETMAIPGCPDPEQPDGLWHPVNAEGSGSYSLAGATANSVNTIFAQLISQLGPENVADMANTLGIRSELPPVCAITLGSVAVNPLEMANAYATLANHGVRHWASPILNVKTASGRTERIPTNEGEQVIDPNDADLVTYALQGVISGGTGSSAAIPGYPAAGKTGTAKNNVDAWFCGYTVQVATCVWLGYAEGEIPLENVQGVPRVFGGTIPAAIWQDFMTIAMDGRDAESFSTPSFEGYTLGPTVPVPSPTPVDPCAVPSGVSPGLCPSESPSPEPEPTEEPSPTESPAPTEEPSPTETPAPTEPPSPTKSPKPTPSPAERPPPTWSARLN